MDITRLAAVIAVTRHRIESSCTRALERGRSGRIRAHACVSRRIAFSTSLNAVKLRRSAGFPLVLRRLNDGWRGAFKHSVV